MSAYFNIALCPVDSALVGELTALAQTNLGQRAENYLLGAQALPHITLCQFQTDSAEIETIWWAVKGGDDKPTFVSIRFGHVFLRPGQSPPHLGKNWVGLSVVPSTDLLHLQKSVFAGLQSLKIDSPTAPDRYFPHLTWGRLDAACEITINRMPDPEIFQDSYQFEMTLGQSDQFGVFSRRLY